ncbi:R8 protein [Coemansia sp. Benny D115]|nr:R8 protein [Coemansia sp. Benny D115]
MFYSHDLLCRRSGRYGTVWLLANAGLSTHSRWHRVSRKELAEVDIPRICTEIILPSTPLSLRLSSNLLVGLAQVLCRKASLLHADCRAIWTRIQSTPWVINSRGFDPFISAVSTVASDHAITLPSCFIPSYTEHISYTGADAFCTRQQWTMLEHPSCASKDRSVPAANSAAATVDLVHRAAPSLAASQATVVWDSISIPETGTRHANERHWVEHSSDDALLLHDADGGLADTNAVYSPPEYAMAQNIRPDSENYYSDDSIALPLDIESYSDQNDSIRFDKDGNLHIISAIQQQQQQLHPVSPSDIAHANLDAFVYSTGDLEIAEVPVVEAALPENPCAIISNSSMQQSNIPRMHMPSQGVVEATEKNAASSYTGYSESSAENKHVLQQDIRCRRPPKRQRLMSRKELAALSDEPSTGGTFEGRVAALWSDSTCLWNRSATQATRRMLASHTRKLIAQRAQLAIRMHAVPQSLYMTRLFEPRYPSDLRTLHEDNTLLPARHGFGTGGQAKQNAPTQLALPSFDEHDDGIFLDVKGGGDYDSDSELEQPRGGSPAGPANEADYLNLHMEIPWLNPKILDSIQRRQSIASSRQHSVSIQTESSPDPAVFGSYRRSASVQGTPASHASIPDLPSSDDGLEIRSFELAAQNLGVDNDNPSHAEPDGGSLYDSISDLDSFLDLDHLGGGLRHANGRSAALAEMDHESASFWQFVLGKMHERSSSTVGFDDLILPPFRSRRVAARAFVDLLQMTSKSVFFVAQSEPFAQILVSTIHLK